MNKIKVLHTDNSIDFTGGFNALLEYIKSEKHTIESVVILPKGSKCAAYLEKEKIVYYEIPFVEIRKNIWSLLSYLPVLWMNAWRIKRIIRKENIKVLHSNDLYNLSLYVVKYFYQCHLPLITHLRLMPSSYPSLFYNTWKWIHLKYADDLIAVSKAVKKAYGDSSEIKVVYDVLPSKEHYPSYSLTEKPGDGQPFRFLYLANYTRGKGQDYAIEAFKIFALTNVDATLTFAGGLLNKTKSAQFKRELIRQAELYQLSDRIILEDFVDDVEFKMKQYHCVLNFSIAESFSFTSYDALRFGVPLIVTDCGGPAELFVNGESGILVENQSINQMVEAMQLLYNNNDLRRKLSSNSKLYVERLFHTANSFPYLSSLFSKIR